ncbi:MAG: TolB family protein, partial [Bacteroidia bacterium]
MANAQNALPDTDIFICDVELKNGKYSFTNLKNITSREGYDNQPSFIDNNTILYTSIRQDKQADIYKYDLKTGKITQVTNTPEDEYSPTLMPDGKHISTVRVEKDSTQRLWKFPLANPNDFSLVLRDVKGVGYHEWINDSMIALFMLGEPFTLQIANTKYNLKPQILDSFIGRSIQYDEKGTLFYLSKRDTNNWCIKNKYIKIYSEGLNKNGRDVKYGIVFCNMRSEDFVFGPDNA